jgi:N-sulfoglucosamine sulfohydrolase
VLVEYVDVVPTLIEAAGGTPRKDLDGRSFLAVLKGETDVHKQYTFSVYNNQPEGPSYPIRAVRSNRFSYLWNLTPQAEYRVKYIMDEQRVASELDFWPSWLEKAKVDPTAARLVERYVHRPEEELYDLAADPWEMNNLADKPEFAKVKADLRSRLLDWMKQQHDPGAELDQPVPERGPWLGQKAK